MSELIRPLLQGEQPSVKRPYFPFLDALLRGVVDMEEIVLRRLPEPVGTILSRRIIPQHKDAGVIEAGDVITAVDLTQVLDVTSSGIVLGPADKSSVDKDTGVIRGEGLITLSTTSESSSEGIVKAVGMVIGAERAQWLNDQRSVAYNTGKLAVVQFGLDVLDLEVVDRDESSGAITVAERKKRF